MSSQYAPNGEIYFGCVPWSNDYAHVRHYTSLSSQYTDIHGLMFNHTIDYTYIDKNRRLKVQLNSDQLRHVNYCMFKNNSSTNRWIYCFVSDITYVNDATTEVELEVDIFQTYLIGTDWTIPPCFVERETVASENDAYLFTNEPDFPLVYTCTSLVEKRFLPGGIIAFSTEDPYYNPSFQALFNDGWATKPAGISLEHGIVRGANAYYIPYKKDSHGEISNFDDVQSWLQHITQAGAIDAISALFTVPDFAIDPNFEGFSTTVTSKPRLETEYQSSLMGPIWGTTVDGYTPHNKKLLYYPYTYCRLTDFNGNIAELRYELAELKGPNSNCIEFQIKYEATGTCQALVYPSQYMGIKYNLDNGIVTNCGAPCSWSNDQFTSWLAQNSGAIVAGVLTDTAAMATGLKGISTATKALRGAEKLTQAKHLSAGGKRYANFLADKAEGSLSSAKGRTGEAALGAGADLLDIYDQSKKPALNRGASSYDLMAMSGMQGVRACRIQVKAELARNIDKFFDTWGYTIEQVKEINVTSRKSWNYVKTSGSMPRSVTGGVSSGSKVFSGGQGTPSDALATIKSQFDAGITFWHTTSGFGNYLLDNTL